MNIAHYIDHTILKPEASEASVRKYCEEALTHHFHSVCVNSCHVKLVHSLLNSSDVKTCSVVGFPLGAMSTAAKAFEAKTAVADGADEIDMVINIGAVKDKNWELVKNDIAEVVKASQPAIVKVIIETCLLTDEEKIQACQLSEQAGAHFVKTSTGFSSGGATVYDVQLMKKTVGDRLQVKASGGIRTHEDGIALIEAGADRLGCSSGMNVM